jgi:SAM-dependent methyltransferase
LERTEERSTLHTLIKLFVVGANVPVDSAAEALSPVSVEHLVACGLLERVGEQVRSFAALDPFGDLLIAHDFRSRRQGLGETGDSVLGVGSSTRYLAAITVRRGGETVLDLGTGQGFQSLLAASHARRVIGTDLNPRTLRFAAISAALNSQTIELREGSLFEPISELEGAFHLIVSNLPFVISPRRNLIAFSGNSEGDSLVERVIRQTPSYLSEGGFACFLGSWGHQESSDWSNRPREWTSGNDCDVLLLRSRAQSARQYAVQWIDESEGVVGIGSVPPLSQWLSYFDQLGYRHFSMGAVIMRKRTEGSNWFAAEGGLDKPPSARRRSDHSNI